MDNEDDEQVAPGRQSPDRSAWQSERLREIGRELAALAQRRVENLRERRRERSMDRANRRIDAIDENLLEMDRAEQQAVQAAQAERAAFDAREAALEAERAELEAQLEALSDPSNEQLGKAIARKLDEAAKRTEAVQAEIVQACVDVENKMGAHKPATANNLSLTLGGPPCVGVHSGFPAAESPWPAFSPPGELLGKHKLTGKKHKRVLHHRQGVVLQGHDIGPLLHVVFAVEPIASAALSALATAFASRKCMFGAAKIVLETTAPLGSCTLTNWPPTPMLYCFDPVPMPFGCAPQSHLNTIRFPMSGMDYLFGWVEIGVDIALSAITSAIQSAASPSPTPDMSVLEKVDPQMDLLMGTPKAQVKSAVMVAVLYGAGESGRRVDATYLDAGFVSASVTVEKTDDGIRIVESSPDDPDVSYSMSLSTWGDVI
jgi:hypothetical protein